MEWNFQTAQEAFEAVWGMKSQINRLSRRIELLQTRCAMLTSRYGPKVGHGSKNISDIWDQLAEERERLARQMGILLEAERRIDRCISHVPNQLWRQLLRYRYLDCLRFPQVGEMIARDTGRHYCETQLYRLHRDAMKAAQAIWELDNAG